MRYKVAPPARPLDFLRTARKAIPLVPDDESERGYHRTREPLDSEALATAYRERVFLVDQLLTAVEAGADSPKAAFETVREEVPRWERERDPEWE